MWVILLTPDIKNLFEYQKCIIAYDTMYFFVDFRYKLTKHHYKSLLDYRNMSEIASYLMYRLHDPLSKIKKINILKVRYLEGRKLASIKGYNFDDGHESSTVRFLGG